ncbi:hypothetical protein F7725_003531 [Dissostichus mawsoni]|uniref:Zona pellucida sperm-binding protein 3 n=1 Tax=Dissostichus mawsoni TaxID=36200 RepID=A0A7J5YBG7_DISMA|nr:hypothetical protein F7725_003531 [Dissostichus mawsoni]
MMGAEEDLIQPVVLSVAQLPHTSMELQTPPVPRGDPELPPHSQGQQGGLAVGTAVVKVEARQAAGPQLGGAGELQSLAFHQLLEDQLCRGWRRTTTLLFCFPAHTLQYKMLRSRALRTQQVRNGSSSSRSLRLEPQQVNTIRVTCHPDSLEIVIKADMFAVGAPVDADEIRLGVETNNQYCRATASSADEYSISVGLVECGTRHWVTEDSLIYTNLLIYSPEASPYGVVRMDEAVIPIECHYERSLSLFVFKAHIEVQWSSSSLMPTWIPFMSTQAAVEMLQFNLRIMTSDWQYKRSSNVFHLGEPISIEASVRIGHHMGLRVFVSSCVATLSPDMNSSPRHAFIEKVRLQIAKWQKCFVDSQLPGSRSQFLARTQDDKLHMSIDAFRFYNEDRGELYITCHLHAVPINDTVATNKAWRSADGNDYLCGQCKRPIEVEQTPSKPSSPSKFRPRGFVKPEEREPLWRSGLKTSTGQSGSVDGFASQAEKPAHTCEERSSILDQISRSTMYGSQWRSGINRVDQRKGLLPDSSSTQNQVDVLTLASEQNKERQKWNRKR